MDDARAKGQVAISREIVHWLGILGIAVIIQSMAPQGGRDLAAGLSGYLSGAGAVPVDASVAGFALKRALLLVGGILVAPIALLMVLGILGNVGQAGILWSPDKLGFKLEKISPMGGMKRMFSSRSVVDFLKSLAKLSIVGAVALMMVVPALGTFEHFVGLLPDVVLMDIRRLSLKLVSGVLGVMALVAAVDLLFQRLSHMKSLRMSRQEIRDEYKETEGDPIIKMRFRQLRMQRARQRMIQQVPKADVVIVNPTHFAIALQYEPQSMAAPVCLAKGTDSVALRIRQVAEENGVSVVENPPLARLLYKNVEVDEPIPVEHYKAVAEVISFVFRLKGRKLA
ncbi:MAG: flagellar biosynthesis protein FlhB [Alphaproteobacteria bacterium GWF2_58_20]|nr:MAG: flagellar biosynthesis protein FlhB [Alphaproteobacteria bacterium GWF2_58_20]